VTAEDRVAIVTGAAGGLGSAVSGLLCERGRRVVMVDVATDRLAAEAEALGELATALPANLARVDECERVVAETVGLLGRVDILVNSAAILARRGWGRIVNLTSMGVYMGGYSMTSAMYEATKGAVAVFTKSFARYGAPRGILVNAVAPGGMRTGMILAETPPEIIAELEAGIPVGRLAEPEEVAEVVVFLTGERMTYAAGATFDVNGGVLMP
jgi:3-oxoacyl-[acyl-carrier protein] reductase